MTCPDCGKKGFKKNKARHQQTCKKRPDIRKIIVPAEKKRKRDKMEDQLDIPLTEDLERSNHSCGDSIEPDDKFNESFRDLGLKDAKDDDVESIHNDESSDPIDAELTNNEEYDQSTRNEEISGKEDDSRSEVSTGNVKGH